ncbi:unnamed protein product [Darwinula stevensoni]|uniref:Uncharacterized protein n=1 Tax=Darwinula stevensoni TaxID=69355 RepID=A0A7R9AEF4_9CRUS|nr:unnamed protein product [Darwinula stevensoni]CAG0901990.1 unnamed protein product [Darwinula stevensoni]
MQFRDFSRGLVEIFPPKMTGSMMHRLVFALGLLLGSVDSGGGCTNAKEFCGQYNRKPGGPTCPTSHRQCGSCLDGYTEEEWTGGRVAEVCRPTGSSDRTQDDLAPGETSQGTELTVIVASIVVGVCCVLILVGVWLGMEALENRKGSEIAQEETPLVVHGFISGEPERLLKAQPENWEEYQSNPCSAYKYAALSIWPVILSFPLHPLTASSFSLDSDVFSSTTRISRKGTGIWEAVEIDYVREAHPGDGIHLGSVDPGGGCTNAKEFCNMFNRKSGGSSCLASHRQCGSCLDGYTSEEWSGGREADVCRPTGSSESDRDPDRLNDLASGETSQSQGEGKIESIVVPIVVVVCCVLISIGVWLGYKKRRKKPEGTDAERQGESEGDANILDSRWSASSFQFDETPLPAPAHNRSQQLDEGMEALENREGSEIAQEETPSVLHVFIFQEAERLLKAQPEDWEEYQNNPRSAYNYVLRSDTLSSILQPVIASSLALDSDVLSSTTKISRKGTGIWEAVEIDHVREALPRDANLVLLWGSIHQAVRLHRGPQARGAQTPSYEEGGEAWEGRRRLCWEPLGIETK